MMEVKDDAPPGWAMVRHLGKAPGLQYLPHCELAAATFGFIAMRLRETGRIQHNKALAITYVHAPTPRHSSHVCVCVHDGGGGAGQGGRASVGGVPHAMPSPCLSLKSPPITALIHVLVLPRFSSQADLGRAFLEEGV